MDRDAEPEAEDDHVGGDPIDVFDALADETRWAIVRELATHRRDNWRLDGLSFADLRRAVGVEDAGRFNYHLDRLTGTFVTQVGDEYVLSNEGFELVGAVLAGAYDATDAVRRGETSSECTRCDEHLVAIYELGYLRLECPTHGVVTAAVVPKRPALDRPIDDLVDVAGRWMRTHVGYAVDGICPHCWGVVETTVTDEVPPIPGLDRDDPAVASLTFVSIACRDCGLEHGFPVHVTLVDHPAVVSFRRDHGDEQRGLPYLETGLEYVETTLLDGDEPADPPRDDAPSAAAAVADFAFETERLLVWLADDATVLRTDRRPADDGDVASATRDRPDA